MNHSLRKISTGFKVIVQLKIHLIREHVAEEALMQFWQQKSLNEGCEWKGVLQVTLT